MTYLDNQDSSGRAQPFGALIAASSLIVALLYLAGFAFRWSYYYNFGAQHLVFTLSPQAIMTASMEVIKQPKYLLVNVLILGGTFVIVSDLLSAARRVSQWRAPGTARTLLARFARLLGADSPLVTDCIRAFVAFYVVYLLSSQIGYLEFKKHVQMSPDNTLPVVTAIFQGDQDSSVACGKEWTALPSFVGNGQLVRSIQDFHRTCASETGQWRLLYRDDKSIYLFLSEAKPPDGRPLTLVLPNSDKVTLVME